jgi:hypothetical protein
MYIFFKLEFLSLTEGVATFKIVLFWDADRARLVAQLSEKLRNFMQKFHLDTKTLDFLVIPVSVDQIDIHLLVQNEIYILMDRRVI